MKKVFNQIVDSFHNEKKCFSARKLTAFFFGIMAGYIHYEYVNKDNCIDALMIDVLVILIALGIVTAQNVIELKNGNKNGVDKKQ